jgi:SAM-dependent methyltransferase
MREGAYSYPGTELELFARAVRWKGYWSCLMRPYVLGDVLEVGAGVGTNTGWLVNAGCRSWTALEPDGSLAQRLQRALSSGLPSPVRGAVKVGTLVDVPPDSRFDTILYIDVLEHIQDDRGELARASAHLRGGGHLLVLAPAHQWLFTPFDEALGHFRRYTRTTLQAAASADLVPEYWAYLDAAGILASLTNRVLLSTATPTARQILTWDRLLVPASRWFLDPLLRRRVGKSVLAVWRRSSSIDGVRQAF